MIPLKGQNKGNYIVWLFRLGLYELHDMVVIIALYEEKR